MRGHLQRCDGRLLTLAARRPVLHWRPDLRHLAQSTRPRLLHRLLWWTSLLVLAFVFASAASYKFIHYSTYCASAMTLVPRWASRELGGIAIAGLPVLESGIAGFLLVPRWRLWGATSAASLLVAFSALLASHYADGVISKGCGCNWAVLRVLTPEHIGAMLIRNGILEAVALYLCWHDIAKGSSAAPSCVPGQGPAPVGPELRSNY